MMNLYRWKYFCRNVILLPWKNIENWWLSLS